MKIIAKIERSVEFIIPDNSFGFGMDMRETIFSSQDAHTEKIKKQARTLEYQLLSYKGSSKMNLYTVFKKMDDLSPLTILITFGRRSHEIGRVNEDYLSISVSREIVTALDNGYWKYNPDGELKEFIDIPEEESKLLFILMKNYGFKMKGAGGSYGSMQTDPHRRGVLVCTL